MTSNYANCVPTFELYHDFHSLELIFPFIPTPLHFNCLFEKGSCREPCFGHVYWNWHVYLGAIQYLTSAGALFSQFFCQSCRLCWFYVNLWSKTLRLTAKPQVCKNDATVIERQSLKFGTLTTLLYFTSCEWECFLAQGNVSLSWRLETWFVLFSFVAAKNEAQLKARALRHPLSLRHPLTLLIYH